MKISQLKEAIRNIVKSKLNKINENNGASQSIMLDDLTIDNIKAIFPKFGEKYNQLHFPNPSDALTSVYDERSLNQWRDGINDRYGNVEVVFYPEETMWFNKVKINNDKFKLDKELSIKAKSGFLDAEREAGRSSGLDENSSDYVKAMDIWKRVKNHPTMSREEVETYKQKLLQAAKKAGIKLDLDESIFSPDYIGRLRPDGVLDDSVEINIYKSPEGKYRGQLAIYSTSGRGMAAIKNLRLSLASIPVEQITPEYVINNVDKYYNLRDSDKKELNDFVNNIPSKIEMLEKM